MKKLLLTLLLVCMVLPMAAYAGRPVDVQGDFTYVPTGCEEERWAGDNQFLLGCADYGDYYQGDFLGTSTEVYDLVMHGSQGDYIYEYGWYKGIVTFDGIVAGRTGTMQLLFVGTSPGDIFTWNGTWRIISGTGDLANLHGNGAWWSNEKPEDGVHYEGQIHFAP